MSLCFATGSRKDETTRKRSLKVLESIEYLSYDLENKNVKIMADFIVENQVGTGASLYGVHRGNVCFEAITADWLKEDYWTKALRQIAARAIGLDICEDGKLVLYRENRKPVTVTLMPDPKELDPWEKMPLLPENSEYVPFSTWKSPEIEPGQCCLFRICGKVQGETYRHLMPNDDSDDPIEVLGGEPLNKMIRSDIEESLRTDSSIYDSEYRIFENNLLAPPEFYHVFFERLGGKSLRTQWFSTDVREEGADYVVDDRRISWYWCDTDFSIYAKANGPVLSLIPD